MEFDMVDVGIFSVLGLGVAVGLLSLRLRQWVACNECGQKIERSRGRKILTRHNTTGDGPFYTTSKGHYYLCRACATGVNYDLVAWGYNIQGSPRYRVRTDAFDTKYYEKIGS